MRYCLLFSGFFLMITACSSHKENKIIPQKDLVPLMVDMHIADAMALNYTINEQFGGLDSALLYNTVLNKYGYTKEQFLNTLEYYSGKPEKLTKIYDEVFSILSKRAEEAKAIYDSYSTAQSRNIWKPKLTKYITKGDTSHYMPPFDFAVDTIGEFVLSADVRITTKDLSVNPLIVAYFYNPQNDLPGNRKYFPEVSLLKSAYKREYTVTCECNDPAFSRIRITIPVTDNGDSSFFKEIEITNLRVSLLKSKKDDNSGHK
jgi:hypothetical protein